MTKHKIEGGKSLPELREEISGLTAQILGLVNRRTEVALEIGRAKQAEGRTQVRDLAREQQVLDGIVATNETLGGPLTESQSRALGELLIDFACDAQVNDSDGTMELEHYAGIPSLVAETIITKNSK